MTHQVRWRSDRGATLLEAMIAVAIVAIVVPAAIGLMSLNRFKEVEARAVLAAYPQAQYEIEWLQANCRDQLQQLVESVGFDPNLPRSCTNYPKGIWLPVADTGVPDLQYRVDLELPAGQEGFYTEVILRVTATWKRPFLASTPGQKVFTGYLYGTGTEMEWDYDEWSTS